jgi:hypothetical protein
MIGRVTGAADGLSIRTGHVTLKTSIATIAAAFHEALPRAMSRPRVQVAVPEPASVGGTT